MTKIEYRKGDVLEAIGKDIVDGELRLLIHICNNQGGWGRGFVKNLSKKWETPEKMYRAYFKVQEHCSLGEIQSTIINANVCVVNMIAQNGYKSLANQHPIDYNALQKCLSNLNETFDLKGAVYCPTSIYCPKIGTNLAGGDWSIIEKMLESELNIPIYVYEL